MEKNKFDVIIIGAGPAGLKCAEQFKDSKLSVLLVEKNEIIGPKVCAGGLSYLNTGFDFPEEKTRKFSKILFHLSGKEYEINLTHPLKIIDRYDFGQHLLNKIKSSKNITVFKNMLVKQIEKNKIITSRGDFHFKYLVGADGSSSLVRKYLGLKTKKLIGLRCKTDQISDKLIIYFNPKLLDIGYAWIFPRKNNTNVGVYFNPEQISSKKARKILEKFLLKNNFLCSKEKIEGAPISFIYKGCVFKNIFLIGDAAGLASGLTGEGISYALVSGEEIGKKIIDPLYKMGNLKVILKFKKRQERIRRGAVALPFAQKYFLRAFATFIKKTWVQKYFGI